MPTPKAAVKAPPTEKESKIEGADSPEKEKANRSKYAPEQIVTLLVDHNPKRPNSASHARFENYEDGMSVKAALDAGVTVGDLNWDVEHDFIKIGAEFDEDAVKKSKAVKEPKPKAPPADAKGVPSTPAAKAQAATKVGDKK